MVTLFCRQISLCIAVWTAFGKEFSSLDINECLLGGGACQQECFNTPGSYHCGCFKGYEAHPGRSKGCRDINECDMDLPDCHKCYNFEGGYVFHQINPIQLIQTQ